MIENKNQIEADGNTGRIIIGFTKMVSINRRLWLKAKLTLILSAYTLIRQKKKRVKRKKHRFWVRAIFQQREELGLYHRLVQELRLHDREYFYRYHPLAIKISSSFVRVILPKP